MRDPGAVARPQDGLERGDQAAGRDEDLDVVSPTHVHVGLAVRDDEQRALLNLGPDVGAQPFGGPERLTSLAQAGFLLRDRARGFEPLHQVRDLVDERLEQAAFASGDWSSRPSRNSCSHAAVRASGLRTLHLTSSNVMATIAPTWTNRPMTWLRHSSVRARPMPAAVVEDRESPQQPAVLVERLNVGQHRGAVRLEKLSVARAVSGRHKRARALDQRAG